MPPSTRIPSHLQPYVHLPRDESLLLLTSTLGASANWLITRFLCDALSNNSDEGGDEEVHNVVLVSWMREYDFWKQEARKGAGLDLERLRREGKFAFVDGLSELCLDLNDTPLDGPTDSGTEQTTPQAHVASATGRSPAQRGPQILPVRGPPASMIPARGPPQTPAQPARSAVTMTATSTQAANPSRTTPGHYTMKSLDLAHLKTTIASAVSSLAPTASIVAQRKTLLVLDNPDIFLALNPTINQSAMTTLILALHSLPTVSHVLTHIQADTPLLSLSTPPQPLEITHHNLLVKLGHMSQRILGVRVLDTGVARDVSGVIRITEQRVGWMELGIEDDSEKGRNSGDNGKGKEFLYQVKGDGSVRVFERGAGGEG
jgi:elongator complex protein 6